MLTLIFLANQVAAGLAVGIFGLGVSVLIGKKHEGFTIEPLANLNWGFMSDIPVIGEILFQHDLVLYLGIAMVIFLWFTLTRTKLGLIIKAVGEAPETAHSIGYPVVLIRFVAVAFGGAMAGIGGAYLTLAYTPLWAEGLVAGRGWIAVALVVFGSWRAHRVALGAYLFGAISLLELSIQGLGFAIPSQALSAAPYIMTIVILVLISRDSRQIRLNSPASLGVTYRHPG
jgi:simple sugar transport system permease protein